MKNLAPLVLAFVLGCGGVTPPVAANESPLLMVDYCSTTVPLSRCAGHAPVALGSYVCAGVTYTAWVHMEQILNPVANVMQIWPLALPTALGQHDVFLSCSTNGNPYGQTVVMTPTVMYNAFPYATCHLDRYAGGQFLISSVPATIPTYGWQAYPTYSSGQRDGDWAFDIQVATQGPGVCWNDKVFYLSTVGL